MFTLVYLPNKIETNIKEKITPIIYLLEPKEMKKKIWI